VFKRFFVLAILVGVNLLYAGAEVEPELQELMNQSKGNETIRCGIVVKDLPWKDGYAKYVRGLPMPQRKLEAIAFLRAHAEEAQRDILHFLESENAKNIRKVWLGNMIFCEADLSTIRTLAQRNDVTALFHDRKYQLIKFYSFHFSQALLDTTWGVKKIGAPSVWSSGYTGAGVVVGCLDSGVRYTHRDLSDHMWHNPGEVPSNGRDDDGNGYVDDYYGYDFVNNDGDPMDDNVGVYHGTHTAGSVAGDGTSGLKTGVAPDAQIMALKVIDASGSGYPSDMISALEYGLAMGAMTFNMSLGFSSASDALRDGFRSEFEDLLTAGVTVAVAAGNGNDSGGHYSVPYDISTPADAPPPWYGSGGHSAVIAVGATNSSDNIASFSSYGPTVWNDAVYSDYPYPPGLKKPDISAPGVNIYSLDGSTNDNYYSADGTSMASPHVAGVIALMLSKNPDLTPEMIDSILETTALDRGTSGRDNYYGAGRVRASLAVAATPEVTSPNIKYYSSAVDPSPGNSVLDPGETVSLLVTLKNQGLDANNVSATLSESSPYITIVDNSSNYGTIARGFTASNTSDPFRVQASSSTPRGHKVWFRLNISASGGYTSVDSFALVVGAYPRTYANLNIGNILYTITNFGYSGYFDPTSNNPLGSGFRYPSTDTLSYMFGGEFLLGLDYTNVVTGEFGVNSEWIPTSQITEARPGRFADQELSYSFVDPTSLIEVTSTAYAWSNAPRNDFAILEFTLRNNGSSTVSNFYTAYYIDWDIDYNSSTRSWYDKGAYVSSGYFAYMYDSKTPPVMPAYVGIAGLSPVLRGSMIDNEIYVYPDSMGWADSVKYGFMTGHFSIANASTAKDWSMILVNGPFTLPAGSSLKVAYVVLAGDNLTDFQNNVNQARQAYAIIADIPSSEAHTPVFKLSGGYPNPFNSTCRFDIELPQNGDLKVSVYDIMGREIVVLLDGRGEAGKRMIAWDGRDSRGNIVPTGLYFVKAEFAGETHNVRVLFLR